MNAPSNGPGSANGQAATARALARSLDSGILSTLSSELPGYPFGSVTPYVLTHSGQPVIQVSSIAQHTRNMRANPKVCLTVAERGSGNKQALGRVTIIGDAEPVPVDARDAVSERYFRFFPEAAAYAETHDFAFYWIVPKRVRYIGGFGQIFWVEPDDWRLPQPAWAASEQGILDHMNDDHADALVKMAEQHGGAPAQQPRLLAVDPEGAHVRDEGTILYVPFSEPAFDMDAVRQAMVQLARGAG